jgi:hypothetical protein
LSTAARVAPALCQLEDNKQGFLSLLEVNTDHARLQDEQRQTQTAADQPCHQTAAKHAAASTGTLDDRSIRNWCISPWGIWSRSSSV